MTVSVVDTNVVLVANGQHDAASEECVIACAERLQAIMRQGKLALDDQLLILFEYQNKPDLKRKNRPGDAFVKWALRNRLNPSRVDTVRLVNSPTRAFESFPADAELSDFDPSDRMFVAVARAHPAKPPILQAVDSKWRRWSAALKRHEIKVDFLCPKDIARFRKGSVST